MVKVQLTFGNKKEFNAFKTLYQGRYEFRKVNEKKKRDKNRPPGARSAYILYSNAMRKEKEEELKELVNTEKLKRLAAMWKSCEEEEKSKYKTLALEDKERAKRELAEYNAKLESSKVEEKSDVEMSSEESDDVSVDLALGEY